MLIYPEDPTRYRIIGIDPGTMMLGISVLEVDLATREVALLAVYTFDGVQLARRFHNVSEVYGDCASRLMAFEEHLLVFFDEVQPHSIIIESPFFKRFVQAFAALTDCISHIRRAVYRHNRFLPIFTIDPPSAKMAIGAPGNATKDQVKEKLATLSNLSNPNGIDLSLLDEHSTDAIAIAYSRAVTIVNYY